MDEDSGSVGAEGEEEIPEIHAEKDLVVEGLYSDNPDNLKSLQEID